MRGVCDSASPEAGGTKRTRKSKTDQSAHRVETEETTGTDSSKKVKRDAKTPKSRGSASK